VKPTRRCDGDEKLMKISLTRHAVWCFGILMIVSHACCGMAAEEGIITGVKLAPDLTHIVIQHNGSIGRCATFVMGHPFRLVLDVGSTCLAKIPGKIRVDRTPISEIRLGYANSRVRVVVDFGDNPVPPFQVERGGREIRLKLGKRLALGVESQAKPDTRKGGASSRPKAASSTDAPDKAAAAMKVKSARVDDNRVIVELADTRNPGNAYLVTVAMDKQDFKVRGATVRDSHGMVRRFDPEATKEAVSGVNVKTVEPWDRTGAARDDRRQPRDAKAKFQWGSQSATHAERMASGPTRQGAFRVEGFVLQPRTKGTSGAPE